MIHVARPAPRPVEVSLSQYETELKQGESKDMW